VTSAHRISVVIATAVEFITELGARAAKILTDVAWPCNLVLAKPPLGAWLWGGYPPWVGVARPWLFSAKSHSLPLWPRQTHRASAFSRSVRCELTGMFKFLRFWTTGSTVSFGSYRLEDRSKSSEPTSSHRGSAPTTPSSRRRSSRPELPRRAVSRALRGSNRHQVRCPWAQPFHGELARFLLKMTFIITFSTSFGFGSAPSLSKQSEFRFQIV